MTLGEQAAVLLARMGLDVALYRQRKVEHGDIALETIEAYRRERERQAPPRVGTGNERGSAPAE